MSEHIPSESVRKISPGDLAPDFTLSDIDNLPVSLHDYRGRKVILYFYPAALTPGCTTQACDFQQNLTFFCDAGFTVIGISPDSPEKLAKFRQAKSLAFTLLSDPNRDVLIRWGAWGEKKNYGKTVTGVIRSTFVIDEEGVVRSTYYNVKATGHVLRLCRDLGLDTSHGH